MKLLFRTKDYQGNWEESGSTSEEISDFFYALSDGQLRSDVLQQYDYGSGTWEKVSHG